MKKKTLFAILAIVLACAVGLGGCVFQHKSAAYEITRTPDMSYWLEVGEEVDFTQYFTVKNADGMEIKVTEDMLDLSEVDLTHPGMFEVTLTIGGKSMTIAFAVREGGGAGDLSDVLDAYADPETRNFTVTVSIVGDSYLDVYDYAGLNVRNRYAYDGVNYVDYLAYDTTLDCYEFYYQNDDGTYDVFEEGSTDFEECYALLQLIDVSVLADFSFTLEGESYVAENPAAVGSAALGDWMDEEGDSLSWTGFELTLANGKISKVVATMSDGTASQYVFSNHGSVSFTLPNGGGTTPTPTPSGMMERQTYNPSSFDNGRLQDKLVSVGEDSIGLPSTGSYHALVIPVQFQGDTVSAAQLERLGIAFNGTEEQTGWESVKTYYQKSSYGKLDITFDIQDVYVTQYGASHYEQYSTSVDSEFGRYNQTGEEVVLLEALSHYENELDLTQYDFNDDGMIDAVYLIYSSPVDYQEGDFFWAYTTWYFGDNTYDNCYPYYYFFAGFDFMDENTGRSHVGSDTYDKPIDGLKVNASTFIHETGHLLGLDDYYDYYENEGSNEGLGGADMMDNTVGDHDVYSKTMLGWLTPTVVNESKTVTIRSSTESGGALLIPLKFDNSYFSEYLLIDLYTNTGLNALHAGQDGSYLYDGRPFGARIYHVSSSIETPYNEEDEYGSFTDYNNSTTKYSLIKLVEADGEKKFASSDGYASRSDLFQTGDKLSEIFPKYTRNDGKLLCFDISFDSVTADSVTVTVTFY